MAYSLVKFWENEREQEQAVVPSNWLRDGYMHWSNSFHAKRDGENCVEIDEALPKFKLIKIKCTGGNLHFSQLIIACRGRKLN